MVTIYPEEEAFLSELEEQAGEPFRRKLGSCGPGVCSSADSSLDLISMEAWGEQKEQDGSGASVMTEIVPGVRELETEAAEWKRTWSVRPPRRARVSIIVDGFGERFCDFDRCMVVQRVGTRGLDGVVDMVKSGELDVHFAKIIIMVGMGEGPPVKKAQVMAQVRNLLSAIHHRDLGVFIGVAGIIPNYWSPALQVMRAVNFNRNLSTGLAAAKKWCRGVSFLPLHLHFQIRDDGVDRENYLQRNGALTLRGAMVMRCVLLREFGVEFLPTRDRPFMG